jgi:flagellar hook-associated protein 3 FlgL
MTVRITTQMIGAQTLNDMQQAFNALSQTQQEVSTGKSILQPSDNPYGASQAVSLQSQLDGINDYTNAVNNATDLQQSAGTALSGITNMVQQVRQLVVEGANGSNSSADRADIAQQVNQLIDAIKGEANTQFNGKYIFSGTSTSTAPYQAGSVDTYQGDDNSISATIGPGVSVQTSVNLHSVLGDGNGDGLLLDTLRTISQNLTGGTDADVNALQTTDLSSLDTNITGLTSLSAQSGATVDRLQLATSRLSELQTSTSSLLSNTQDADVAQAMINYSQQQSAYTASLQAGSMILQESLLNFLH